MHYKVPEFLYSPPTPSLASEYVFASKTQVGEETLACGEGGGGIQFRQLDRNSGILYCIIPLLLHLFPSLTVHISLKDDETVILLCSVFFMDALGAG
jgi:hypothetical protein